MAKKDLEVEKHVLVPEHRKLSEEEKAEVISRYNANEKKLPKIKKTDPAIKNLNPEEGDIIEIKRKSSFTNKPYIYYRVVIL